MLLSAILTEAGYEVSVAGDAEACVGIARSFSPSLVLIDLHMPGANGLETAERLRSVPGLEEVPMILVSDEELDADCDDDIADLNGFLHKAKVHTELLDCVELHLEAAPA